VKLQTHIPTVGIRVRDWRATMIALAALVAASMVLVGLQTIGLLNNPLLERAAPWSITHLHDASLHRISLDPRPLSDANNPARRFSVAHPQPANVTLAQLLSIGTDARGAFEMFGDSAHSAMLADDRTVPQFEPREDRLLMMLMLLQLHPHRD
jgi:hypothetical protein